MIVPAGTFGAGCPICALALVKQHANANITTIRFIIFILQSSCLSGILQHKTAHSGQAYQIDRSLSISAASKIQLF